MAAFSGLKILDLTHVLAGPFAAYQLALLGADVIKIEAPGAPDQSRETGTDEALNQARMGTAFLTQAANKRSLTLDLKQPQGREILLRLARDADVLVENYRPGALTKLGCGPEALAAVNPALVYCSISAFGQTGPRAQQTAYDLVIQAVSGLMSLNGTAQTAPVRLGAPVIDYATGMMGAFAISAALFQRSRTGIGQHVELAMADVAAQLMGSTLTGYLQSGTMPVAQGNGLPLATQGVFETADGQLMLAANNARQQRRLWIALDRPELMRTTAAERRRHVATDRAVLADTFRARSADAWEAWLQERRIPAARIRTIQEAMTDPQAAARGRFASLPLNHPAVEVSVPVGGMRMSEGDPELRFAPRGLGADTDAILATLGYTPAEIHSMRAKRIV